MQKPCQQCGATFQITPEDLELYQKFEIEPQPLCFECDQKQRLCFRNEHALYTRKCDATGETIISIYAPDNPYKVYKSDYWYSDKWDPLEYGQEFNFQRPFFEQLKELQLKVPRLALNNINPENSDYCNSCIGNKNCYLVFGGDYNEDCMYGTLCMKNRSSLDLDILSNENELCYMLSDTVNCYGCQFAFNSSNSNNCYFISDCTGCSECILSNNLKNKSYYIFNKPYSKEEYFKKKAELLNGSWQQQQENYRQFLELLKRRTVNFANNISAENCTGDYIKNSQNCHNCYDVTGSQDGNNVILGYVTKDCLNSCLLGHKCELCYNIVSGVGIYNTRFSFFIVDSSNIDYCNFVENCQDLFACVGLKQKKYCILNKQYSKEEYVVLRAKIIEHMEKTGEWAKFLPKDLSCFGYNETTAQDYYPLTKEQALKEGFQWRDEENKHIQPQTYNMPDQIKDVPDSISSEIFVCQASTAWGSGCGKNFKIIPQELKFYRQMNIPLPHQCPNCRHIFRMSLRNPRKLWERHCAKCGTTIQTSYSPERPETVYCKKCYLKEIY